LLSSPRAHAAPTKTALAPSVQRVLALRSARSFSVCRAMPGMRSPGRTAIAPFASALELLGLFSMKLLR
jgi:hypothetical protein